MPRKTPSIFRDVLFLAFPALFFMLYQLGLGSLATWDEALYALVAKEIVHSGDWLRLTIEGKLWFDKPPLALWATALFYKTLGIHEFSSRLFSALCGAGTVIVTYLLGRELFNRWTGICAALVLLSSSHFLRVARFGVLDMPLTFFITLSFYFFWRGQTKDRHLIFSGVCLGLALVTKGFGALLVIPILWIYCAWAGRLEILTRRAYWAGMVAALMIALPWNLYELLAHRQAFLQDVVFKHLVLRTTGAIEGHAGGIDFYLRTIINKFRPWMLIGVVSAPLFLWKALRRHDEESIFIAVWMFFILLLFTLVRTKLAWYIVPLYPALSISIAYVLVKILKQERAVYVYALFLAVILTHVFYSHVLSAEYSRPIKNLAPAVRARVPEGDGVYLYRYHEQFAADFYFERKSSYLDSPAEVGDRVASQNFFYCLVRESNLKELEMVTSKWGLSPVASSDGFVFLAKN